MEMEIIRHEMSPRLWMTSKRLSSVANDANWNKLVWPEQATASRFNRSFAAAQKSAATIPARVAQARSIRSAVARTLSPIA